MKQPTKPVNRGPTDNWKSVAGVARAALPPEIVKYIEQCRGEEHSDSLLIAVLHRVQAHFGHLGKRQLDAVAQLMQIPAAQVTGVATFYHFFRLQPRGRFIVSVCLGTACYVKGAEQVARRFQEKLGIGFGQTTADGLFTLESTRCLGTCGLAPVVMVNDQVHANVTPDQVPALLERYARQAQPPA